MAKKKGGKPPITITSGGRRYRFLGNIHKNTMPYAYNKYNKLGYSIRTKPAKHGGRYVYVSETKKTKRRR